MNMPVAHERGLLASAEGVFSGKRLLISGGTGSFGNAVVRRFLQAGFSEIRILSRDEKKQDDMRRRYGDGRLKFCIGDVRDYQSVLASVRGVDYIFHAAALKQVPSCEFYPLEALKTNVLGTENVLEAAVVCGVALLFVLSTDKGGLSNKRDGYIESDDGEGRSCEIAFKRRYGDLRYAVWERDGISRVCYPSFCRADSFRRANNGDGSGDDSVHDDFG